ncbi:low affinity iron permease family protein [Mesorhizobium sp. BR1-1-16]|uniref:low affinity iron permease family protein n=1 Tax=Mesorhizobium sp. BR1-1-16 TaxID=2876653 RepID=UPI001CCFA947|nr:low affinity iron permease family protein [Mesorhizobium sp. BR1-1-16]MBZ9936008.1 low affinity iron permease family protein [Mesorhizobium sp. BR1-1-16]
MTAPGLSTADPVPQTMKLDKLFATFANRTARATGSPFAFLLCVAGVVIWAVSGPVFGFSETWQLVINTSTTIITFLMVFLIQNTQNRDGAAVQTKLDELIRSSNAEDEFMGIEKLTDEELERLHLRCEDMARRTSVVLDRAKQERRARGYAV